ncbi:MAG: cysteine desulfurase-like protein [Pirellulaceae bacterium]
MKKFDHNMAIRCRDQFPGLSREVNGKPAVFFDGPAGTQVPQRVADAVSHYLLHQNANHGGCFATSRETDEMLDAAGNAFAEFVGTNDRREIIFGQNMTSLTFAFSRSLSQTWNAGDEILVSAVDHDANVTPWATAAADRGATIKVIPFRDDDLILDLDAYRSLLSEKTRLVAVGCACNASGGLNPVKQVTQLAHEAGAEVFLDAVHYGPHGLIDVTDWGCDYLGFSAYKFFGPHLGALWVRLDHLERLSPYKVRPSSNDLPWRWMTGTQSHESIAGGMAAIDYLADIGREISGEPSTPRRLALRAAFGAIREFESELVQQLIDGLQQIEGIRVYGITEPERVCERVATVCFTHEAIETSQLNQALAERGCFVWGGNYYALEFTTRLGLEPQGMIRAGLVHYNTADEVQRFLTELKSIVAESLAGASQ